MGIPITYHHLTPEDEVILSRLMDKGYKGYRQRQGRKSKVTVVKPQQPASRR